MWDSLQFTVKSLCGVSLEISVFEHYSDKNFKSMRFDR
jgi:hypothetical protein